MRNGKRRQPIAPEILYDKINRVTLQERYSGCLRTDNLSCGPSHITSDADIIFSFGVADAKLSRVEGRHGCGATLRFICGDKGSYRESISAMTDRAIARAKMLEQPMAYSTAMWIAKISLAWLVCGKCQHCSGTGMLFKDRNEKFVNDEKCPCCDGTGKSKFSSHFENNENSLDVARWLVHQIISDIIACTGAAIGFMQLNEMILEESVNA